MSQQTLESHYKQNLRSGEEKERDLWLVCFRPQPPWTLGVHGRLMICRIRIQLNLTRSTRKDD